MWGDLEILYGAQRRVWAWKCNLQPEHNYSVLLPAILKWDLRANSCWRGSHCRVFSKGFARAQPMLELQLLEAQPHISPLLPTRGPAALSPLFPPAEVHRGCFPCLIVCLDKSSLGFQAADAQLFLFSQKCK